MNCYEFRDNISAYVEKELALPETSQFDVHLERCPSCRKSYEGVLAVISALRRADRATVSKGFNERLQSRLRGIAAKRPSTIRRPATEGRIFGFEPRYAFAVVATVVAIVVLSISLFTGGESATSGNPIPIITREETPTPIDIPQQNAPASPSRAYLASDSDDDSLLAPDKNERPARILDGNIRLVKDQR